VQHHRRISICERHLLSTPQQSILRDREMVDRRRILVCLPQWQLLEHKRNTHLVRQGTMANGHGRTMGLRLLA